MKKTPVTLLWSTALVMGLGLAVGCGSKQKKAPETAMNAQAAEPAPAESTAPPVVEPPAPAMPEPPQSGAFGTVKDAAGNPIAGVTVMVPKLNAKFPVNDDGTFSIELAPTNKTLTLMFTASGYMPSRQKISVPAGQPVQLSVVLKR